MNVNPKLVEENGKEFGTVWGLMPEKNVTISDVSHPGRGHEKDKWFHTVWQSGYEIGGMEKGEYEALLLKIVHKGAGLV